MAEKKSGSTPLAAWRATARRSLVASAVVLAAVCVYAPVSPAPYVAVDEWFVVSLVAYLAASLLDAYARTRDGE